MKISRSRQLAIFALWAAPAAAQVVPVDSASFNWPVFGAVVVVLALIAGFVLWKRRATPEEEAHALHEALRLGHRLAALLEQKTGAWEAAHSATGAAPDVPAPPAPGQNAVAADPAPVAGIPAPTAHQLAAMEQALGAYNQARAAAGLPPI